MKTRGVRAAVPVLVVVLVMAILFAWAVIPGLREPDTVSSATSAPPTITSVAPTSGWVGTSVTVNGSGYGAYQGSGYVSFSGVKATSYTTWSNTSITCLVPNGATSGPLTVTTFPGTSNSVSFRVNLYIASLSPTWGNAGATTVTISGSSFGSVRGTSAVWFGHSKATIYTSWQNSRIQVRVPAGAYGRVSVRAVTPSGYTNAKAFDVRPIITGMAPTSGGPGTVVTLNGSAFCNLQGAGAVYFGSVKATSYVSWKQSQIKVRVPSSVPAGSVQVKVYTTGGMSNYKVFTKT